MGIVFNIFRRSQFNKIPDEIWRIPVKDINGLNFFFGDLMEGKKLAIISNVGTYWYFAKVRSDSLNSLIEKFQNKGLQIIGFPCS